MTNAIEVTDVRVFPVKEKKADSKLEAFASIVFGGVFCIKGIRIVNGKSGPFVSFPQTKGTKEGEWLDLCFPVTKEFRDYISEKILSAWSAASA